MICCEFLFDHTLTMGYCHSISCCISMCNQMQLKLDKDCVNQPFLGLCPRSQPRRFCDAPPPSAAAAEDSAGLDSMRDGTTVKSQEVQLVKELSVGLSLERPRYAQAGCLGSVPEIALNHESEFRLHFQSSDSSCDSEILALASGEYFAHGHTQR